MQISDKSEIVSDQICFLVQNSTFYLPEKALNDEQMLELIDFYAKRDYSVTAQGQKDADVTNASVDDVTEISQEEALEKASTLLEQLYGIDTDTLVVETEHDQALDGNRETFTTDHITYRDEAAGISYMVSVNLQNGEIKTVSAEKDTWFKLFQRNSGRCSTVPGTFFGCREDGACIYGRKCCVDCKTDRIYAG